jgi:hypothetical protein
MDVSVYPINRFTYFIIKFDTVYCKAVEIRICLFYLMCFVLLKSRPLHVYETANNSLGTLCSTLHSSQSRSLFVYSIFCRLSWRDRSFYFTLPVTCTIANHSGSAIWRMKSWVRIPHKAWMSVCVYSMFVLGSSLESGWSPVQGVLPIV